MVCVVVAVAAALAYSKVQTPMYKSTALIQINSTSSQTGQSATPVTLPDPAQFLGSTAVQLGAAKILGDPDVDAVASEVTGTVDPTSGALTITATASTPEQAQGGGQGVFAGLREPDPGHWFRLRATRSTSSWTASDTKLAALEAQPVTPLTTAQIAALTQTCQFAADRTGEHPVGRALRQHPGGGPTSGRAGGAEQDPNSVLIGLVAGLLVGCGIALARDQFDTRLRRSRRTSNR